MHFEAHAQRGPSGPAKVITSPVKLEKFHDKLEALGTSRANESIIVTADTLEKLSAIHFEEGQYIKRGELLVTLDKSQEEAELKAAEATLIEARSAYNRAKELQSSNALSKAALLERKADLEQAEALLATIKARLDDLEIRAPFDGMIGLREVSIGALVQPGDVITTLDDLNRIKIDFQVPSVYLAQIRPGLTLKARTKAYGKQTFLGTVTSIDTQINPSTRTLKVRAIVDNTSLLLRPGLLMELEILNNERHALLIPEESIIKRGTRNFVFKINSIEGKTIAQEQEIVIGSREPGRVEVLSGLNESDQIINHGTLKVRDGQEVVIVAEEHEDQTLEELLNQKPASGN
jgi:membrane fusion protein (multidrug efflux system)